MKLIETKRLVKSKGRGWMIAIDDGFACYKISERGCDNLSIRDIAEKILFNLPKWNKERR